MDKNLLFFCVLSFFVSVSSQIISPCPEVLNYEAIDANQWQATLNLASEDELHGLWLRIIFNSTVSELKVDDNFGEVVASSDNTMFLIKDRDFIVQSAVPKILKITVSFDGDAPSITTIRLNAKEICTSTIRFESLYLGDLNNKNFLESIAPQKVLSFKEFEGCGVAPLADKGQQYPWQASLYFRAQEDEKFICEAVLISPKHLLVPAHCVTYHKTQLSVPARNLLVYFGNYENKKFSQVERIFVHPGYRFTQLFHDLAILQLKEAVVVDDEVKPICFDQSEINFNNEPILVGFKDEKILAQAKMEIIPEAECVKKSPKLQDLVNDNVYCFNYVEDIGSCVGASGSSLIAARDASKPVWELKGIVTIGAALQDQSVCNKDTNVLVLDTENYIKWIQQTLS